MTSLALMAAGIALMGIGAVAIALTYRRNRGNQ